MKMAERDKQAWARMKPGVVTAQGFLGNDERELPAILAEDLAALRALGLEPEDAASALERLRDAGARGMGEPVTVAPGMVASTGDARGVLPCPWGDGVWHKNSVRVVAGSDELVYSDLSIHMLRAHGFCQGRGSPFRLEPAALGRIVAREGLAWK